jgi:UDP:flavonoid glycosyltransferase YjiC (YdhE family)
MKIILKSIGTRGDMEPFLAIGGIVQEKGHRVICVFPKQCRNLAEDLNLQFASLECKLLDRHTLRSRKEAGQLVFHFIEGWYNPHRRHSSIGYASLMRFRMYHATSI